MMFQTAWPRIESAMTPENPVVIQNYRTFKRNLCLIVAILILLTVAFSVRKSMVEYRLTVRAAELQTRGYARALREHAERAFGEADTVLLDTIDHIKTHGGIDRETGPHLREFVTAHSRNTPQIGAIILVNREGMLFAHSLETPVKQAIVADREYFIHHRSNPTDDTPFISRPVKSRINGKWRFTLSRPVRSANGTFEGLVAVAFEMDYFRDFYASLELGEQGRIVMVRKDGALLLSEPFKDTDFSKDFKQSHLFRLHLPKAPRGTFHIEAGQALLKSDARIISYDSLEHFPVVANANMGFDEVTAQWRRNTRLQAALTLVVSLSLCLLTLILLRQLRSSEASFRLQREQQLEISAAAEAWRSTFDAVEDAIWIMDLNRHILRANAATERIFGADLDRVVGLMCCEVAHQSAAVLSNCPFEKMLETGHRASMQITLDGRWYEVSVDPVKNEAGTITGAVHIVSDITGMKQAEELALENAARMSVLLSAIPDAIFFKDSDGRWLLVNHAGIELFCLQQVEYVGRTDLELAEIVPQRRDAFLSCMQSDQAAWELGGEYSSEESISDDQGYIRIFDAIKIPIYKADGTRSGIVIIGRDVTDKKQMEMQLRQAQKMEAIGHLAGGIAHDFNNLLTPILGYAEMIANRLPAADPLASKVSGISAAAHKAKDLTQQLLSFGRRQAIETCVMDLNEVIDSFFIVLRRTVRESVHIKLKLDPCGAYVTADRSQMEQIILNMTVNAQDALGGKGDIAIETCTLVMEGEDVRLHPGMVAGEFVLLSFRDTGCGMNGEVLAHIFEPFFTTKAAGHGTGLGLATVYGIVKQHNGFISVTSRVGAGTTFRIYLPASTVQPLMKPVDAAPAEKPESEGVSVLVVEDNDMVREMVRDMLEGYGYSVLTAADPAHAIEIAAVNRTRINLLVSDVVMPGMNGPELFEQLVVQIPALRVVYISGYPMNPSIRGATMEEEVSYLQKPFTAEALIERIRLVM
jgi:PAS domain S-box-containing protein